MIKLQPIRLAKHPELNEQWVQDQIANDPTILGLGDLALKDKERPQVNAGRLDLLLQDPESLKRYEVEVQLGATDESHLIRTIEYWDIEKRRYPQYEHAAVIIAEDITSRFLNVIHLFNGHIPLIALKMTAYQVEQGYALTFVKVLDEMSLGLVDDDEPTSEPVDRSYWLNEKGSDKSVGLVDELFEIVQSIDDRVELNYTKHYIGIKIHGRSNNFVTFIPKRSHVIMTIKITQNQDVDEILRDSSIHTLKYDSAYRQYRLSISNSLDEIQNETITSLSKRARQEFGPLSS